MNFCGFHGLFKSDGVDALVGQQFCEAQLILAVGASHLHDGTVAGQFGIYVASGDGVYAKEAFTAGFFRCLQGVYDGFVEILVEVWVEVRLGAAELEVLLDLAVVLLEYISN